MSATRSSRGPEMESSNLASSLISDVLLSEWEGMRDVNRGMPSFEECSRKRKRSGAPLNGNLGSVHCKEEDDWFKVSTETNQSLSVLNCFLFDHSGSFYVSLFNFSYLGCRIT